MDIKRIKSYDSSDLKEAWIKFDRETLTIIDDGLAALQRELLVESRGDTPPYPEPVQKLQELRQPIQKLIEEFPHAVR